MGVVGLGWPAQPEVMGKHHRPSTLFQRTSWLLSSHWKKAVCTDGRTGRDLPEIPPRKDGKPTHLMTGKTDFLATAATAHVLLDKYEGRRRVR